VYYGNVATVAGGAFFGNYAYPYINNTSLVRNTLNPPSETGGKTIALSGGHLQNSIIWNGDEDFTPHVIKLDLTGDTAKVRAFANNIERDFDYGFVQFDPSFTNIDDPDGTDNFYGTDDDGLYLGEGSFVRNYGLIDGFVNHRQQDVVGNPRLVGRKIDLGAYETQRTEGRLGFRDVMRDLRKGGLVLMYRHGKTDWESKDPGPSKECFPGRNLIFEGREQCTGIGAQQRMLGIPVGDLFTSPACRCWETLQKMHGSYTVKSHWGGGGASGATADARMADLETVPTVGNRFISTHDGVCQYVFNRDGGGEIITTAEYMEGDCLIIRPLGDTLEILAQWCSDTWERYHVRFPDGETSVEGDAPVVQIGNVTAVPQPAAEQVRLTSTVGGVARVVDATGRMYASLMFDNVDRQVTVEVANYPQGTYYLVGQGIRGSFVVIR
jgi:phosphohistidine phosphatase SixA